jgi:hypothetical protein
MIKRKMAAPAPVVGAVLAAGAVILHHFNFKMFSHCTLPSIFSCTTSYKEYDAERGTMSSVKKFSNNKKVRTIQKAWSQQDKFDIV